MIQKMQRIFAVSSKYVHFKYFREQILMFWSPYWQTIFVMLNVLLTVDSVQIFSL